MIVRIVRLDFVDGGKEKFFGLLDEVGVKIRNQPGCTHLEILEDVHKKSHVITYSYWESEEDLNNYRNSLFFRGVWPQIKALLAKPASANSYSVNRKID
ncbi:putative quinol monooxygenase [Reichenbachiella versicolor]|uniref:putative quinol monooxygenase n=1 Tax=Reichenbachiella versicolor TaxID=1821036 RepID=UPI000D6EAA91|nr:antibiotic biosynthesis monooxygenase family protein [Reichenbachiella versicolor]